MFAKITAYEPSEVSCAGTADGITATGKNAWSMDGVAADPKLLPYGTKVYIPDVGYKVVDDTGSALKKSARKGIVHIDVRFQTIAECKKFGVKYLPITILGTLDI